MTDLRFYGASDDLIEFEGALSEEFDLDYHSGVWTGLLRDYDDNSAQLRATWCKENPNGWHVQVTDSPWPVTRSTRPDSPDPDDPDPMLIIDVPDAVFIEETP